MKMAMSKLEQKKVKIELDTSELNAQQIRLVKSINHMLAHVLTTDDECDYFDGSSDLMKMVASAVKQANFTSYWSENSNIPYAQQALEFSVDALAEQVGTDDIVEYDN